MRMRMQRSQRLTDCTHWTKQMKALPLEEGKKERELKAAKARTIAAAARATASTEARKVPAYAYVSGSIRMRMR
jgi:hypothetical protein